MRQIDLTTCAPLGVHVEPDYFGGPDGDGVLERYRLRLPEFEVGAHYSAFQQYDLAGRPEGWWPDAANRTQALAFHAFGELSEGGLFALLRLADGCHLALLPLAGPQALSWFAPEGDRLGLKLGTLGTEPVEGNLPVLGWAFAQDPYRACREVWRVAVEHPMLGGAARRRERKRYPEPFRYLGWCSWEQYRKQIDAELIQSAVREIERSALPVRYALVDDGHLDHRDGQLVSFGPNGGFPDGWRPLLQMREADGVRWMGLWLNFNGYWQCVAPENALGSLNEHLTRVLAFPAGFGDTGERRPALLPAEGYLHATAFYEAMVGAAAEAGFDFVKIDNQARNLKHYRGAARPVACASANSQALEAACGRHVDGLINCMAHSTVCALNTRFSAVSRCSEDYRVGNLRAARRHLHNSYANILWLGQTVWGDHDMFHSSDPVSGRVMAVSKALSGGPVYLSDNPAEFDAEAVQPLCFEDGELLRPLAPAAPLPDSIYLDPFAGDRPFRVIAPLPNRAAAVAAYNLTEPERAVAGRVDPADYEHAPCMMQPYPGRWRVPEGLVIYDRQVGEARPLREPHGFSLPEYGHRFWLLCPVRCGWAVIGRVDKYLSPAAVEVRYADEEELILHVCEAGPLALWREGGRVVCDEVEFHPVADRLWRADMPVGARDVVLRCQAL